MKIYKRKSKNPYDKSGFHIFDLKNRINFEVLSIFDRVFFNNIT